MTANAGPLLHPCPPMIGHMASPKFGTCRSHPRGGHAQLMSPQSLHLSLLQLIANFLVSPSFASSTHNSDDMYTDKGRARDVHNRGGALFCLLFLPRDSCKLGLCNSHRELRGQMTTDKRMQDLYLLNDRHVPGHATAQDRGGRMENLDRALTAMGSRATGCAAWGCHITLPTAMSTRR